MPNVITILTKKARSGKVEKPLVDLRGSANHQFKICCFPEIVDKPNQAVHLFPNFCGKFL